MADRYLLESGSPDGYLLEDGTGVLSLDNTTLEIVNNSNTVVTYVGGGSYRIKKTAGAAGTYDASAVSSVGIAGDFVLSIRNITGLANWIAGVNSDPLTDNDYASIDRGWVRVGDAFGAALGVYESSVAIVPGLVDNTAWIWRTGTTLGYGRGASLATAQASPDRTVTDSSTLYFDSSLTGISDELEVYFYLPAPATSVALTGQSISSAIGSVVGVISQPLTGQGITAARGSVSPTATFAITGQALAAAQGQVLQGAPLLGQSVTAGQGSTPAAVTLALTGQGLSVARGSVTASPSLAITGQSVAAARGSTAATSSPALSGQTVTVSRGSLLAASSLSLSGQSLAVARGTVAAVASPALVGQSATAQRGTVLPASAFALSGAGVVTGRGTIAPAFDATLGGQSLIAGQGVAGSVAALALAGGGIAVDAGSVVAAANNVTVALSGQSLSVAQGFLTAVPAWTVLPRPDGITLSSQTAPSAATLTVDAPPPSTPITVSLSPSAGTFTQDNRPALLELEA